MKIGMFFSHFVSSEDLEMLFQWCKKRLIVNIFAATCSQPEVNQTASAQRVLNIFTFNPFGSFHVINVTDSQSYTSFFPSLDSNFQQHQLRLAFPFNSRRNKEMWLAVFQLMNASYVFDENNYTKRSDYLENELIIPKVSAQEKLAELVVYPMVMIADLIIVPDAPPYSDFTAYLRSAMSDKFCILFLITILGAVLLLSIFRYIKQKKILIAQSVADVLNLIMNDNEHIKYQRLSRIEIFLIVPLTFVGFVIVNGILSNMQSYLTEPVLQPQINTIEEIYRSPFPILATGDFWPKKLNEVLTRLTTHDDWSDKIIALPENLMQEQIESYNRSICFFRESIRANTVLRVQKWLNIKGFHNPQIEISMFHYSYLANESFIYLER